MKGTATLFRSCNLTGLRRCSGAWFARALMLSLVISILALSSRPLRAQFINFPVQPLGNIVCVATFVPNLLRSENLSSRTGDSRLDCTNDGIYNPNLSPAENNLVQYAQLSIQLSLNTAVSNRTDGVTSDAVLVVNGNNSYLPLGTSELASPTTCGGSLTDPLDAPDQRFPCPQKGVLTGPSTITWDNIMFPVPGAPNDLGALPAADINGIPICDDFFDQVSSDSCFDLTTTLRFTNVRGNAAALGAGGTIIATLGVTAFAAISVMTNQGAIGIILPGLLTSVVGDGVFQCTAGTNVVAVTLQEGFAAAFKVLGSPGFPNGDNTTENGYPVLTANIPGAPPQPVGATGGGASQATRFRIGFTDVPAGVTLTMPNALDEAGPVTVCMPPPPGPGLRPLCLQRVAGADVNGRGGTLIEGPGSSDVPVVGGNATAIYELVSGDPFIPQQITVDATFLCAPGSPQTTLFVTPSLAPTSNVGVASVSAPKPRFIGDFASPDLLVTALTAPTVGSVGGLMPVSATVQNASAALADPYQLGFYFSTDATITSADVPSTTVCSSGALAPGAGEVCSPSIVVPPELLPGPYFLGAIADDLGEVSESDETNNTRVADSGSVQVVNGGMPPTADAGPDQFVQVPDGSMAEVMLDGSGSSDPDGDPLTYTWTGPFPEGGGTVLGVTAMVTLPPGVHTVTLSVDDGNGGMGSDTVDITVNQIPVANAGLDQLVTVAPGDTAMVTLDGSGSSDPDGDPLTYAWTNSFGNVMGVMPTVTLAAGVHVITLTVDDGKGGSDADTVEITVNQAPVAVAGPNQVTEVPPGKTAAVTLGGAGSFDPDGDALTFTWTNSFGTAMGVMPIVLLPAGVHVVMLTVDDGKGGMDTDTVTITVDEVFVAVTAPSTVFVGGLPGSVFQRAPTVG